MTRHAFPDLNDLIGRPYRFGARGPAAFDCWGLVLEVRRRLELVTPPDFATRVLTPEHARALFHEARPSDWRRVDPRHGAIAYAPDKAHAGVQFAGRIVHAVRGPGVVAWSFGRWLAELGELEFYEWQASSSC
jgi:cell wall-associated NlpC family hydrolase